MARIRTIKPEFFSSPTVGSVSIPARLLFVGLLTESDDAGLGRWGEKRLSGVLFGHDSGVGPKTLARWAEELVHVGLVELYQVDGDDYFRIPGFLTHQRINRPTPTKFPPPLTARSLHEHNMSSEPSPLERKGTGNREQGTGNMKRAHEDAVSRVMDEMIFELLTDLWGPAEPADRAGLYATVTLELLAMDATPDQIRERTSECLRRYPMATPRALANHWHELGTAPAPGWMTGIHQAVTDVEAS